VIVDVPDLLTRLGIDAVQKGEHWWARCPFHEDSKPSWRIRDQADHPMHGKHHCFACEGGGSAVWLVMHMLGMEARPASTWIASGKQVEAKVKLDLQVVMRARKSYGFELPPGAVVAPFDRWPAIAHNYAIERNLTEYQVDRWGLGYAREGRLRGRLVIPIRDGLGRLRSYTARSWGNADRKYLEPRTEEGADKTAVFGEEHWPEDRDSVVLCEGALNALAVERAILMTERPIEVAALEGSQFLPGHVMRVGTFPRIYVAADPDKAGDKLRLALRGLSRWCELKQLVFPHGFDACDVEKKQGLAALAELVEAAA